MKPGDQLVVERVWRSLALTGNRLVSRPNLWIPFAVAGVLVSVLDLFTYWSPIATYPLLEGVPTSALERGLAEVDWNASLYPAGRRQFVVRPGAFVDLLPHYQVAVLVVQTLALGTIGVAGGVVARLAADRKLDWRLPLPVAVRLATYVTIVATMLRVHALVVSGMGDVSAFVMNAIPVLVAPWLFAVVPLLAIETRSITGALDGSASLAGTLGRWFAVLVILALLWILQLALSVAGYAIPIVDPVWPATLSAPTVLTMTVVGTIFAAASTSWYELVAAE